MAGIDWWFLHLSCQNLGRVRSRQGSQSPGGEEAKGRRRTWLLVQKSCLVKPIGVLKEEMVARLNGGNRVEVCYLYFRKNFESCIQKLLKAKVGASWVLSKVKNWIAHSPKCESFRVRVNGCLSDLVLPHSGVARGPVLRTVPFPVYAEGIIDELEDQCLMFACDIKFLEKTKSETVQRDLDKFYQR